jgi:hypothetical protein
MFVILPSFVLSFRDIGSMELRNYLLIHYDTYITIFCHCSKSLLFVGICWWRHVFSKQRKRKWRLSRKLSGFEKSRFRLPIRRTLVLREGFVVFPHSLQKSFHIVLSQNFSRTLASTSLTSKRAAQWNTLSEKPRLYKSTGTPVN